VGTEHDIDPGSAGRHDLTVLLRQAAAHGDLHPGPGGLGRREPSEVAVEPVVGVLPDRAGVEHHQIRLGVGLGPAVGLEDPGDALRVMNVHLAAVGDHLVGAAGSVHNQPA
jgi:hypothetical protein